MTNINASVYWIRLPEHTNPMTEGYVGISKNFDSRMIVHQDSIQKGIHKNPHLVHAVAKYGWDNLIKEIIFVGDEVTCYIKESELRPKKATGWNIAPGGHRGPGWTPGKKRSPEYLEKMRIKNAARRAATMDKKINERRERITLRNQKQAEREAANLIKKQKKEIRQQERMREVARLTVERERRAAKRLTEGTADIPRDLRNRPICVECNKNHCAINYIRKGKTYYRRMCDSCGKLKAKKKPRVLLWEKAGYKKKPQCDLCGFKSLYPTQMTVFHIDGDLNNVNYFNLKTICLNCVEVVKRKKINWKRGDLVIDY